MAVAHSRLADVLAAAGRQDEAIAEYRQAIHLDPEYAQSWVSLGANLFLRAATEKSSHAAEAARGAFEQALKLDPHNQDAVGLLRDVNKTLRPRIKLPRLRRK